jgi:hypothetical protein
MARPLAMGTATSIWQALKVMLGLIALAASDNLKHEEQNTAEQTRNSERENRRRLLVQTDDNQQNA